MPLKTFKKGGRVFLIKKISCIFARYFVLMRNLQQ